MKKFKFNLAITGLLLFLGLIFFPEFTEEEADSTPLETAPDGHNDKVCVCTVCDTPCIRLKKLKAPCDFSNKKQYCPYCQYTYNVPEHNHVHV